MKSLRILLIVFLLSLTAAPSMAQCPMCKAAAESSLAEGNKRAKGLNSGILYLLAMPYLAVSVVGFMWYKKYRRKQISNGVNLDQLNMN